MKSAIFCFLSSYVLLHIFIKVFYVCLELFIDFLYGLPRGQLNSVFLRFKSVLLLFGTNEFCLKFHYLSLKVIDDIVYTMGMMIRASTSSWGSNRTQLLLSQRIMWLLSSKDQVRMTGTHLIGKTGVSLNNGLSPWDWGTSMSQWARSWLEGWSSSTALGVYSVNLKVT